MDKIKNTCAIILAGGNGTRLRTIITDRQKVVAEINGRPFLGLLLAQIEKIGIRQAIICTGYLSETVDAVIEKYDGQLKVSCSHEKIPLGTGGAIKNALSSVKADYCLIMNGDSFIDINAKAFFRDFATSSDKAVMALAQVSDVSRYGAVVLDKDRQISSFSEKSKYSGEGLINAGVSLISKQLLEKYCPQKSRFSLELDVFPYLAKEKQLFGFVEHGIFIDIGVPEAYRKAAQLLGLIQ